MYKVVVFLTVLNIFANGLIVEKTVTPSQWIGGQHTKFEKFGFEPGGLIEISGTINPKTANTFIYFFSQDNYQTELKVENWIKCDDTERARSDIMPTPLDGSTKILHVPKKELYYFSIIDCSEGNWEAHLSYTLYSNSRGNHLSLEEIPLPTFYIVLIGLWILLLIVWSIDIFVHRKNWAPLHTILWCVLLLKNIVVSIITFYWWIYSTTGYRYDTLSTLQSFLFAFSETTFFCALFLISKGWRILRAGLPAAEIRSTFIALLVLLSTLLFFSFYSTDSYYWLSLILMYFFMLPKIFTSISQNIRILDAQINTFTQAQGIDTIRFIESLTVKRVMFYKVRNVLVAYIISMLLINSLVRVVMTWEYEWVSRVSDEMIVLFMFTFVLFHLRPSRKIFFTMMEEIRPLMVLQNFLQNRINDEEENAEPLVEPWDISKTIAIQWPFKPVKKHLDLTRIPMSLGYEVDYLKDQEKNAKD